MDVPGSVLFILLSITFPNLKGAGAANVGTIIDMRTSQGAAFFTDIAVAPKGGAEQASQGLYFTDSHAHCIRQWTGTGITSHSIKGTFNGSTSCASERNHDHESDGLRDLAGECDHTPGFRNGAKGHALFDMPRGICYHPAGFLVVADSQNACIRRVSLDGVVSTLAGQCMSPGDQDGDPTEAQFSAAIEAVACLQNCSILVTDPSSRTVRIITPDIDCPGQAGEDASHHGQKWVRTVAGAIGVLGLVLCGGAAAYGASRYVRRRISRKRGEVEDASRAAATPVVDTLRGKTRAHLASYDDSAYRQQCSTRANVDDDEEAPLIILNAPAEERSSGQL